MCVHHTSLLSSSLPFHHLHSLLKVAPLFQDTAISWHSDINRGPYILLFVEYTRIWGKDSGRHRSVVEHKVAYNIPPPPHLYSCYDHVSSVRQRDGDWSKVILHVSVAWWVLELGSKSDTLTQDSSFPWLPSEHGARVTWGCGREAVVNFL